MRARGKISVLNKPTNMNTRNNMGTRNNNTQNPVLIDVFKKPCTFLNIT